MELDASNSNQTLAPTTNDAVERSGIFPIPRDTDVNHNNSIVSDGLKTFDQKSSGEVNATSKTVEHSNNELAGNKIEHVAGDHPSVSNRENEGNITQIANATDQINATKIVDDSISARIDEKTAKEDDGKESMIPFQPIGEFGKSIDFTKDNHGDPDHNDSGDYLSKCFLSTSN